MSRAEIFASFGSFDERLLDEDQFILAAAGLLDPHRVPGLAEALTASDTAAIAAAVLAACRKSPEAIAGKELPTGVAVHVPQMMADDVIENRFTFYGETHRLPPNFDWDDNPGTAHWGHDLNRFSFLHPLTNAYVQTGDDRYARKVVDLILSWIDSCAIEACFAGTPYAFGSYLNNTIHCAVWARCLETLLPTGIVKPIELLRMLKSLHDQICYLEVVTNGHAGNWPTIGCQGVLATVAALPVFRDLARFTTYFVETLGKQVEAQVLPDGVQDELTPHYHTCVINNILTCAESCAELGLSLDQPTLDTCRSMVRYQAQTVTPNRSAQVAFNDSDPESVPDVSQRLQRLGLGDFIPEPESLGPEAYPFAGVAFLRQPPVAGDLYLAFDGGPFGRSHQHEDKLGFWLHAYGHDFLVDPGRHLYDHSAVSFLSYLVSTRAHSTITIDGQGQHSRGRPDTWIASSPGSLTFVQSAAETRAAACYDLGYGPENAIWVTHQREVVFVEQRFWLLFDTITGTGVHTIDSRFQYGPGEVVISEGQATTQFDDANLLLATTGAWDTVRILTGETDPRAGWYSASYNKIEPAPALSFVGATELPCSYAVLLLPYRGRQMPDATVTFDRGIATVSIDGDTYDVAAGGR